MGAVGGGCPCIESEIDGKPLEGRLFDGAKTRCRGVTRRDAGLRVGADEAAIAERCKIEAEAVKVVSEKGGAAHFRVDGIAVSVGESQPERKRGKLVDIGDKAPIARQERLRDEVLLVTTLMLAVDHAEIGVANGSVLTRIGPELSPPAGSAPAAEP